MSNHAKLALTWLSSALDDVEQCYQDLRQLVCVVYEGTWADFSQTGMAAGSLTHWGRVTHICVGDLTIISSDNGLSPGRHQAIIWTNAGILLISILRNKLQWNPNRNSYIFNQENAIEYVIWKMSDILSRPQCVKLDCLDRLVLENE